MEDEAWGAVWAAEGSEAGLGTEALVDMPIIINQRGSIELSEGEMSRAIMVQQQKAEGKVLEITEFAVTSKEGNATHAAMILTQFERGGGGAIGDGFAALWLGATSVAASVFFFLYFCPFIPPLGLVLYRCLAQPHVHYSLSVLACSSFLFFYFYFSFHILFSSTDVQCAMCNG